MGKNSKNWPRYFCDKKSKEKAFRARQSECFLTTLSQSLAFEVISSAYGLGIVAKRNKFEEIEKDLTGKAWFIPINGTMPSFEKLTEYASVAEFDERKALVYGPISLVNHSCTAALQLGFHLEETEVVRTPKEYHVSIGRVPKRRVMMKAGKEIFLFYRSCKESEDFVCEHCQGAGCQGEKLAMSTD